MINELQMDLYSFDEYKKDGQIFSYDPFADSVLSIDSKPDGTLIGRYSVNLCIILDSNNSKQNIKFESRFNPGNLNYKYGDDCLTESEHLVKNIWPIKLIRKGPGCDFKEENTGRLIEVKTGVLSGLQQDAMKEAFSNNEHSLLVIVAVTGVYVFELKNIINSFIDCERIVDITCSDNEQDIDKNSKHSVFNINNKSSNSEDNPFDSL